MTDDDSADDSGDGSGDPFERLGDVDRDGDPFERLGDPDVDAAETGESGAGAESAGDGSTGDGPTGDGSTGRDPVDGGDPADLGVTDPYAEPERSGSGTAPGDDVTGATETSATVGQQNPASDIDQPGPTSDAGPSADDPFGDVQTPNEDPFGAGGGAFERVDVGDVDADEVWDAITGDGEADDEPEIPEETRYSEVSKHSFCEQCEYFSEPPDVHCNNELAEIIEFVDMETVRLLNCPVVAERNELE